MRDGSIVGEVFFVKIVFLEKRNDRTRFEMIRKGTRDERKVTIINRPISALIPENMSEYIRINTQPSQLCRLPVFYLIIYLTIHTIDIKAIMQCKEFGYKLSKIMFNSLMHCPLTDCHQTSMNHIKLKYSD